MSSVGGKYRGHQFRLHLAHSELYNNPFRRERCEWCNPSIITTASFVWRFYPRIPLLVQVVCIINKIFLLHTCVCVWCHTRVMCRVCKSLESSVQSDERGEGELSRSTEFFLLIPGGYWWGRGFLYVNPPVRATPLSCVDSTALLVESEGSMWNYFFNCEKVLINLHSVSLIWSDFIVLFVVNV